MSELNDVKVPEKTTLPENASASTDKWSDLGQATAEIEKLKDENIKRRLREKESQELIKKMEEESAARFSALEKQLREAKLAKEGIETAEGLELYEFFTETKKLPEAEAIQKVKALTVTPKVTPPVQTGLPGRSPSTSMPDVSDFPQDFGALTVSQKTKLLEANPGKYHELLAKFKGK